jgi:hypothetical protein
MTGIERAHSLSLRDWKPLYIHTFIYLYAYLCKYISTYKYIQTYMNTYVYECKYIHRYMCNYAIMNRQE